MGASAIYLGGEYEDTIELRVQFFVYDCESLRHMCIAIVIIGWAILGISSKSRDR